MTVNQFADALDNWGKGLSLQSDQSVWTVAAQRVTDALNEATDASAKFTWEVNGEDIIFRVAPYVLYQNYGVRGRVSEYAGVRSDERTNSVHSYGTRRPHASFFSRYSSDTGVQWAIAQTVYMFGIPAKDWFSLNSGPGLNIADSFVLYAAQAIEEQLPLPLQS